mgnify:CR=1 FL=1
MNYNWLLYISGFLPFFYIVILIWNTIDSPISDVLNEKENLIYTIIKVINITMLWIWICWRFIK